MLRRVVARPFPFEWLPRYSRAQAALSRSVLRRLAPVRVAASHRPLLDARWHALLGGRAEAWPHAPALTDPRELLARHDGRTLAAVFEHHTLGAMAVLLDVAFGLTVAARALGEDEAASRRAGAAGVFAPEHEGALALVCAQAAALVCAPAAPPRIRAVTDQLDDVCAALGQGPYVCWPWRATVGLDAGEAVLVLAASQLVHPAEPASFDLALCAPWRCAGRVVLARAHLAAATLSALETGDVLALEGALGFDAQQALTGPAVLAFGDEIEVPIALHARRVSATDAAQPRSRRISVERRDESEDTRDATGTDRAALLGSLDVEVEVVIARGDFAVGEVAAWRNGEVITLPSRIGDAVSVRAGGRVIARGELCDVDGQVGVRVTELL